MVRIRCHFDGKTLVPDEPVDLPEGQPLVVHVEEQSAAAQVDKTTLPGRKAGQSFLEWITENAVDDPSLPSDGAYQHDHYLYGTPKKP